MDKKVQALAVAVKKSSALSEELKAACQQTGTKFTTLKIANATRFNSKWICYSSVLKMKTPLKNLFELGVNPDWRKYELSSREWKLLEAMVTIQERVLKVNKVFETEISPTMHLVIPKLFDLKKYLEGFKRNHDNSRLVIDVICNRTSCD